MHNIIYYGVGRHLEKNIQTYVHETGMPVCLIDKDVSKQNTFFYFKDIAEKREILSLNNALEKYSDYLIYITLGNRYVEEVYNELINSGVERSRIKPLGGVEKEYRYGCRMLNGYTYVQSMDVKVCAHFPYTKVFPYKQQIISKEDIQRTLTELEKWREDTIQKMRNGEKTSCEGCSALQFGAYDQRPRVTFFAVGPNFSGGTRCNANCFYCNQNEIIREKSIQSLSWYDVHKIGADFYDDIEEICLADGEPSIMPQVDELFELIDEKGWGVWFNTNAIVYKENISRVLAKNKRSFVACAIDAGTRETFEKIKRVDKYDAVLSNLRHYKEDGCRVYPKYILIPGINDDKNDMDNFIDYVRTLSADGVTLSQNLSGYIDGVRHEADPDMPEEVFSCFAYMIKRFEQENIPWQFQIEFISRNDFERIEKLRKRYAKA